MKRLNRIGARFFMHPMKGAVNFGEALFKTKYILALCWCVAVAATGMAQVSNGLLQQLKDDEQKSVAAIALYPESERTAILEVSTHPELLVRMKNIRENTQVRFKEALSDLPEEDQKKIFNLARYPELISDLCYRGEKPSAKELDPLLTDYPEDIQEQARQVQRRHYEKMCVADDLYRSSDEAFTNMLREYPPKTQEAYQRIAQLPEVVSILNENMSMTVLLGDIYKRQPEALRAELDSLNLVVAEQRARELNDWKNYLEEHPEAMSEYEEASKAFAREQGYDEAEYSEEVSEERNTEIHIHHYWRPYPYWFGWPWWYTYDYWYPYPYWVHWGYYYGPGDMVVFVGYPSSWYMHWYFNHHAHFYYYPHFTDHLVTHYHGHRESFSGVSVFVREWEEETRSELPEQWLKDDGNRVERIREYGKMKMDYQALARESNDKAPTQSEYLRNNAEKYPALKPDIEKQPKPVERQPQVTPPREPSREYQPPPYQPRKKVIDKQPSEQERIDRAKDYHRNTWERIDPPRQTTPQKQSVPQPRQPQRTPSRQTPSKKAVQPKK